MILRLADPPDVPPRERDAHLVVGGFAPRHDIRRTPRACWRRSDELHLETFPPADESIRERLQARA